MPLADFIHLRVHSAYSLSAGAIKIKELVQLCRAEAMPAVAITDTGNLFGALEFATACAEGGVQPVIGCEIALRRDEGSRTQRGPNGAVAELDRIILLVQSETGYRNLMDLVSRSFLESESDAEPAVSLSDVAAASTGLLCLSGGAKGPLGRLIAEGQADAAASLLSRLQEAFPARLYIEVQRHGTPEEMRVEGGLVDLAYARDLPLVATNDCYFPDRDFYEAHDALICIAEGRAVADQDR
jgi:DNA polymerase-3 subunit alpha